jgi:hypothetical protein
MSLSHETVLELMALADGELEGEARSRAEKLVTESDEARRLVDGLRGPAIGAWLSQEMSDRASMADGIADAVMAKLGAETAEPEGVVRLMHARVRPRSRVQLVATGLVVAFAAAAGIAIYMRPASEDRHAPVASVGTPSVDMQLPPVPGGGAQARPGQGGEVDEVD